MTPDGRTLAVLEAGAPDGPVLVSHHGAPSAGRVYRTEEESAREKGRRLITYDRPGYGGSTPHRGRRVGDAARDLAAILDALGITFPTRDTRRSLPSASATFTPGSATASSEPLATRAAETEGGPPTA